VKFSSIPGWLALACAVASFGTLAQSFPSKPVRFIVPFAPGGQSDVVARTVGQKLSERWGQPVIIENKPGAATTLGTDFVAKAPADGYTIPLVAVVNPTRLPVKTFAEFVAAVKKEPGKISYGTPGNGSLPHLAVELFGVQSGTSALHVPYKGGGPAVVDLVGGQISFMFASPLEVMPHVKAGRLLTLGVTSDKRVSYWPDVPTLKEAGYKEYEAYAWFGVVAPAATPRDIIAKLNADIVAVLKSPDVSERLAAQGADVAATSAEEFGRFLAAEHVRWSAAVKAANVTVQ
jgi:tripartite-type tricarboxylate transporter receptor subunit TctC